MADIVDTLLRSFVDVTPREDLAVNSPAKVVLFPERVFEIGFYIKKKKQYCGWGLRNEIKILGNLLS